MEFDAAEQQSKAAKAAATFFDVSDKTQTKKPRLHVSQLQDLRESPQVFAPFALTYCGQAIAER